jgi:hypothetical protein
MPRARRTLLAVALLAALPGCQVYEDYLPWTWHFSKDMKTGRTFLTREVNGNWSRRVRARRVPAAGLYARPPSGVLEDPPPRRGPLPAKGEVGRGKGEGKAPLTSALRPPPSAFPADIPPTATLRGPKWKYVAVGYFNGYRVYRRVLPSQEVAAELGARGLQ